MAENVLCGKALRKEKHEPHFWRHQSEDDAPREALRYCIGYLSEGD